MNPRHFCGPIAASPIEAVNALQKPPIIVAGKSHIHVRGFTGKAKEPRHASLPCPYEGKYHLRYRDSGNRRRGKMLAAVN